MRMKKLSAGALQMVLYISVIIAIMLAAFILLIYTQNVFEAQTNMVRQTVLNTNRSFYQSVEKEETTNNIDSLSASYWGVYKKIDVTSRTKNISIKKSALTGGIKQNNKNALFLKDQNKPLVVVGNSKISGKAYLPARGIRSGQIAGKSYYGTDLKYGDFATNKKHPEIPSDLKDNLKQLIRINELLLTSEVIEYKPDEKYVRSFQDLPQVLFSSEKLVLSNNKIVGHYLVVSNKMIEVKASSKLTDVILIAPKIVIRDNVQGAFQAVASEHLEVGNNCQLNYPSSLTLVNVNRKKMPNEASQIFIGKNSKIKGSVLYVKTIEETSFLPNIFISEEAIIYGELYCENNLDLRGTVYGSVVTSNFIAAYGGSVYQNHLFNGKILSNELPQEYVGLNYSGNNNGIVKWLY